MDTARPTYRDDPEWKAAQRRYLDGTGTTGDPVCDRVLAAVELFRIERASR